LVFIIFFTVFLGIFFLGSWYVYNRGAQALSETQYGTVFKWVFWILSFSFILGQFLERGTPNALSSVITYIGSFWLVILWYLFLFVVAIDIVRLTNGWWQYIPHNLLSGILKGPNVFVAVMSATLLLVFAGHINALNARIINVDLDIDKPGNGKKELKVALVTDIHMGHIIGNKRVSKLIDQLNKQSPDLVLFGGDLVDHNPLPVIKENMGEHFDRLNPPLGKFAVTGNHEYIGKPDISIDYLSKFGIQYIRDTIVNVNDVLYIIGREDREMPRFNGKNRQNVSKLVNGEAENKLVILMDHQPVEYNSVAKAGIDLMVSGHTHKGQFWPFGMITKRVFELDWGLKKKGNTHFYVSSGYGTWGPPVRIGSRPEIVIFNIKLN
jgi:predicted MPP superfamily phosphohydrolase